MVLKILGALAPYFPTQYTTHVVAGIVVVLAARAVSQGRKTTRERDLHGRVILMTGAFSPTGLTLLESLAQRGAHVIALSADPIESERVTTYIDLLRSTTSNEQIFAEHCDLDSPPSIQAFCKRFVEAKEQRLDAILFTHEYHHIGASSRRKSEESKEERESASLATFLLTTLLLPALLTAPVERDIRIINVVNRFYAAAAATSVTATPPTNSIFLAEGTRSLRSIVLIRHLQRILDALPTDAQVPKPDETVVSPTVQKSNIVAVSVSPGISRVETAAPLLGTFFYILLYPLLLLTTKSAVASIQTILHVLFLPTPFKVVQATTAKEKSGAEPEELLKPGALYAECAVVRGLRVRVDESAEEESEKGAAKGKGKGKAKEGEVEMEIPDDGELGGERAGRLVWEEYERALKKWEAAHPPPPKPDATAASSGGPSSS
ncbi:hypothetical protein FB45DRAFT_933846 [Roridomyces roridus]|uniref:Ketoreductase (KR) domain-containing protein n=1 Tax=Roridomyces roridus TaxID=1738132 RepID=A0AAD7BD68_9AGAR|nr:hypothetical protein FB45DRAFT_933846 [Roridomyces roridus]